MGDRVHDDQPDPRTADDAALERIAAALRERGVADRALDARLEGFDARVMAAVLAPPSHDDAYDDLRDPRPRGSWLLRRRTIRIRPLSMLATAAALLLVAFGAAQLLRRPAPAAIASTAAAPPDESTASASRDTVRLVQFVLLAPAASRVELVGDFNHWQGAATPLRRTSAGLWSVELPLPPGRYTYTFVVDGTHFTPDPAAPRALGDDFGTPSSVVTVSGGRT